MNFDDDLIFTLTQFSNAFRDALDKSLREIGLYSGQIYVLILLWRLDGQTQISLAQTLNLSAPTVHKMIKSLNSNGYVDSRQCEDDARQSRIYLTEQGANIRPLVEEQWSKVESKILFPLTETERLIFRQLIIKLKKSLLA